MKMETTRTSPNRQEPIALSVF